jgi:hypothetical protein
MPWVGFKKEAPMKKYYPIYILILIIALISTNCDLYPDHPIDLKATDGEYPDKIELSWQGVAYSEDTPEEDVREVDYYEIERSEASDFSSITSFQTTGTTYTDESGIVPGRNYYYRVYAHFDDGSDSDYSNVDTGYAMDASAIQIGSAQGNYTKTITSGPTDIDSEWFYFHAQDGWTYNIETYTAGNVVDTDIFLYEDGDISSAIASETIAAFNTLNWKCDKTKKYLVEFEATNLLAFNITAWHE